MAKSKFFRVAVEGDTVDGRKIERNWLTESAASYNPATYAARVNMEHIRGITADKPFKAYGDVLALKAEEVDLELGGKTQRKMALFAEIEPTDDLVAINRDKQKLYTSIEVSPNFANTGKAYCVGIGVTDSPASLGTERLTFAVQHPDATSLQPKPLNEGNVFSLGLETSFELASAAEPAPDSSAGLIAAATAFFKNFGKPAPVVPPVAPPARSTPADPANDNEANFAAFASGMENIAAAVTKLGTEIRGDLTTLRTDHEALKTAVGSTEKPGQFRREPATGGSGALQTDC